MVKRIKPEGIGDWNLMPSGFAAINGKGLLHFPSLNIFSNQIPVIGEVDQAFQSVSGGDFLRVAEVAVVKDHGVEFIARLKASYFAEEGTTMVVVTHEMDFARKVANWVVYMEDGVIVEEGPSKEFFSQPKSEKTMAFLHMTSSDYVI